MILPTGFGKVVGDCLVRERETPPSALTRCHLPPRGRSLEGPKWMASGHRQGALLPLRNAEELLDKNCLRSIPKVPFCVLTHTDTAH